MASESATMGEIARATQKLTTQIRDAWAEVAARVTDVETSIETMATIAVVGATAKGDDTTSADAGDSSAVLRRRSSDARDVLRCGPEFDEDCLAQFSGSCTPVGSQVAGRSPPTSCRAEDGASTPCSVPARDGRCRAREAGGASPGIAAQAPSKRQSGRLSALGSCELVPRSGPTQMRGSLPAPRRVADGARSPRVRGPPSQSPGSPLMGSRWDPPSARGSAVVQETPAQQGIHFAQASRPPHGAPRNSACHRVVSPPVGTLGSGASSMNIPVVPASPGARSVRSPRGPVGGPGTPTMETRSVYEIPLPPQQTHGVRSRSLEVAVPTPRQMYREIPLVRQVASPTTSPSTVPAS